MEGRVVDPEGHPLAGIPVYVALADPKGYERADQQILFTRGPDSDGGLAEAKRYGEYARTTATGAFRLDAEFTRRISSGDGGVRIAIASPAWVESKIASGEEGGEVHAEPAASLAVRVVDDAGAPIPEFRAVIREASRHGDHGIAATNGGFVAQWRRRADLPPEVNASLAVWAPGRRIERKSVTIPADRASESVTIDLGPVEPDGKIVLHPVPAWSSVGERTVIFTLSFPERPDDELLRVRATWDASDRGGAFVASLPPGRFRVHSYAWDTLTEGPIAEDTLEISSGATIEQTWTTSSWGKARSR